MNFDDGLCDLISRAVDEGVDVYLILGSLDTRREEVLCRIIMPRLHSREVLLEALAKTAAEIETAQNGEGAPE